MKQENIRNFCIIAHIDHGKSTLADRMIEMTNSVDLRDMKNQLLDSMDIERERGITIKSQAVSMTYSYKGEEFLLNLVDTPGHVDFSYEVSRAISSCEGALLLVDAAQGVEAQTLANLYLALEHDLTIIPVINKIDLPSADIEGVKKQIDHDLGLDPDTAVCVSAKAGTNIDQILEAIVTSIPAPTTTEDDTLKALIFDSHYDPYRGVIVHVRIFSGSIKEGDKLFFFHQNSTYKVEEAGKFKIKLSRTGSLVDGEVGYIICGIKNISDVRVGDTVTSVSSPCSKPLKGFKEVKPVVYSSIYPVDTNDYNELVNSLEKLKLNDASLVYEKDSSAALGFGFRCGFLGLLHLEVIQQRLEREFDLSVIFTSPSVQYKVALKGGSEIFVENPAHYPDPSSIETVFEPYIKANIITPDDFLGPIMNLCLEKRGVQIHMNYLDTKRVELVYEIPLAEVLYDFYDTLKSISRGYASFDYEVIDLRETNLVKVDILVNGEAVDALSLLVHKQNAEYRARVVCKKLREEIPRHQFKIPIQGSIGTKVIARETISAMRKDVTAKCYGGDISRKKKLLQKQKEGKKRMKLVGNVELPQNAFLAVLKSEEK
ncbi:MAG: elongation factor 4 [Spirochaetales bacterium]|nr:elongation factor 4 [Spirochaetales bacterium]